MLRGLATLLLLAGCAGQPSVANPAPVRNVDSMVAHTVLLHDPGCTGVRVGNGEVLTAKHCIKERVTGDAYDAYKVKYISPEYDFAVLSGDTQLPIVLMPDAQLGEHLYVVGYPTDINDGKQHLAVTDGVYVGTEWRNMQRITAYAYYGNSGGGCWNDAGELLGILVELRLTDATTGDKYPVPLQAYTYIVPVRYIRGML